MRKTPLATALAAGLLSLLTAAATPAAPAQLTLEDVQKIMAQAISRAEIIASSAVIAITDREGFVLGVWSTDGTDPTPDRVGGAISEAGTPTDLSTDDNAFSSRTAHYLIQQNFPPGIDNTSPGPLVGIEFSQLPFTDTNRFKRIDPGPGGEIPAKPGNGFVTGSLGTGIPNTRLSGRSSGVPLYKDKQLVGGIGVFTAPNDDLAEVLQVELNNSVPGGTLGERVALAGQIGYAPSPAIYGSNVTINGIRLPYVLGTGRLGVVKPLGTVGKAVAGFSLHAAPPLYPYPVETLGGQQVEFRFPVRDDPNIGTLLEGQSRLSADDVRGIVGRVAARAAITRSSIKLPIGKPVQIFVCVVGNPAANGVPAPILATARTIGSALFDAIDVCPQKARTALFFSNDQRAFSTRTVGFLAQNHYPPGLNSRAPGPFGPDVPSVDAAGNPIANTIGLQPKYAGAPNFPVFMGLPSNVPIPGQVPPDPNLPDGINLFGGGFPLYRNGVLIGALGASGDGVEVDDLMGAAGVGEEFQAPEKIRADQFTYDGARLPYTKFPRNPGL
jgi:uncharacterized protein GlcG (DUF336 family)